jgi:adenylosuccinate lyase
MQAWREGTSFKTLLAADSVVAKALPGSALDTLFDLGQHTRHVDTIFARVFGG